MLAEISLEEAQKAVKGVSIPPQPKLLVEINKELAKPAPDSLMLGALIARDVGLSGAVLKVINSPFFGMSTKVSSIPNAVQLLGINNVQCIITGLLLKAALGGAGSALLERFWGTSESIAKISTYISSLLPKVPRDETYTFGLFRECGIPLLMQRFPDYMETLAFAGGQDVPMTLVEDEIHGTNHAVVGYMVAKSWGLPEHLNKAILYHHEYEIFSKQDEFPPLVLTYASINYLAEYLNDEVIRMRTSPSWRVVGGAVLDNLGFSNAEFNDLREDIVEIIR